MARAEGQVWRVVAGRAEVTRVITKSRFIALLAPVTSVDEAAQVIAARRKEHYGARHHCSALILGDAGRIQRSSDDGEPSGTAGLPMLEVLRRRAVTDVVAVVTRYFGGVLLGAGGLVRAYSGSVAAALDDAVLLRLVPRTTWALTADFIRGGRLENALRSWCVGRDARVDADYGGDGVVLRVEGPPEIGTDLAAFAAAAGAEAREIGTAVVRRA